MYMCLLYIYIYIYIYIYETQLNGKNTVEWILQNCSFKPLVWQRYIDDIFLLWQHEEEKLKEFLDILNAIILASNLLQNIHGTD